MAEEYDWTAVIYNLHKAKKVLERLLCILGREEADRRTPGNLYISAVQATLLFGF